MWSRQIECPYQRMDLSKETMISPTPHLHGLKKAKGRREERKKKKGRRKRNGFAFLSFLVKWYTV